MEKHGQAPPQAFGLTSESSSEWISTKSLVQAACILRINQGMVVVADEADGCRDHLLHCLQPRW